jgi:diaminohydroxyphosphoribosylaminopyrimidine deaminase/5-amino-6-(5-phosphoribosylamino)uracil reductase
MNAGLTADDERRLARAVELARRGEGRVEPNPMVGCVLVREGQALGEGWHQRFGGPHAEIEALAAAAQPAGASGDLRGATAYVSLEPCCSHGKTPPCTEALLAAGVSRVVVGCLDPNPQVAGGGVKQLREAGLAVDLASGEAAMAAQDLIAPFAKLMVSRRPWIVAKWAMTLDGKIAARDGSSQWISGPEARVVVHALRGRMDAVLVGRGTVERDDPLLTARPPGLRTAVRIVLDSRAQLPLTSRLVQSASEAPVLVAAASDAPPENCRRLAERGVEVWRSQAPAADRIGRLSELLDELGRRQLTNVLVEGGPSVLGSLHDAGEIDEVHVFLAPKLLGGVASAVGGHGAATIDLANRFDGAFTTIGQDGYFRGRAVRVNGEAKA